MRLESFRLQNHMCFFDTGPLTLAEGFNLIVGVNNVGKSALLQAMQANFVGDSTRSPRTYRQGTEVLNPISKADVSIALSGYELRHLLLLSGATFLIPVAQGIPQTEIDEVA